jgi:hypothetical protein
MIIKEFQLFESNNLDKFPSIEEVKSYFYDFTDELNTFIDDYDYGYLYFMDSGHGVPGEWNGMVDILDTVISNTRLEYNAEFIRLNREYDERVNKNRIKFIESGEVPGYDFLFIHFENYLFKKDKLPILIDCLKTFYSQTGLRLIKSLWTEDYVDSHGEVVTHYGFEGTFLRVSDDEYKKMCQIFQQGNLTPTLTKLF